MDVRGSLNPGGRTASDTSPPRWLLVGLAGGLLAATGMGGCGGDPPTETVGAGGSRGGKAEPPSTPDSARLVENQQPAWPRPARLELVTGVRGEALSAAEGEALEPAFGSIRDVAPAGNGRILVLDGAEARVSVLDRTGSVLERLGGPGPGPGELTTPDRAEAAPGGGVLVLERRPPAIHRWRGGEYRGAVTLERAVSAETPDDSPAITQLADWGPSLPGGRAVRLLRLDVSDPSASGSALYAADSAGRIGMPVLTWTTPGTRSRLPEVFGARRSWTAGAGPDGEARFTVARGDRYEIRLHDASGELRTVIRRDAQTHRVTDELRERALEMFTEEAGRAGAPPAMIRDLRERIPVADVLPVIGGVWHSAPDGRIWVGLVGPGPASGPPSVIEEYDVYGPGGRYLGRVASPPGFELHRVDGALLYGSWRDSLDVPGVRVYRMREPEEGGVSSARAGP